MTTSEWPSGLAVLRLCRCCARWLSIDHFVRLGKVCTPCVRGSRPTGRIARSRSIVLIPQREALKEGA